MIAIEMEVSNFTSVTSFCKRRRCKVEGKAVIVSQSVVYLEKSNKLKIIIPH